MTLKVLCGKTDVRTGCGMPHRSGGCCTGTAGSAARPAGTAAASHPAALPAPQQGPCNWKHHIGNKTSIRSLRLGQNIRVFKGDEERGWTGNELPAQSLVLAARISSQLKSLGWNFSTDRAWSCCREKS